MMFLAPMGSSGQGSGRIWPVFICGLIGMNMCIVGATIYFALSDSSAAVEPDYYRRALSYDDTLRQEALNARLGWTAAVAVDPSDRRLLITLRDSSGKPVDGARVDVEAFANLRSAERQRLALSPTGDGQYAATLKPGASGRWRVRMSVMRGADTWTHQSEVLLPPVQPAGAGA